jgi:Protein of unknown function (DUF2637)
MRFSRRSAPDAPPVRKLEPLVLTDEIRRVTGVAVAAVLIVIGIAAAVSYSHMFEWAKLNGESDANEWRARIFPVSVDGAILAGSMIIYVDSRTHRVPDKLAYVIVVLGMLVSIGANIGHDWMSWLAAKIISGWPPLAMALVVELLFRFLRRGREQADQEAQRVERAQQRRQQPVVTAPVVVKAEAKVPESKTLESEPDTAAAPVDLTAEMRLAGWAPRDYATAGAAMRGYLEKVDPNITGAELDRLVAGPFFDARPGQGRQIVRKFKDDVAAATSGGKE